MTAVRWLFVAAVIGFAGWGLRDRGDELREALLATPPAGVVLSAVLVVLGLVLTSVVWLRLLAGFGRSLPAPEARSVFFVGQLGKYLPGGLWSLGAQADLARRHVPLRTTVATGLVFLGLNVVTALAVTSAAVLGGAIEPRVGPVPVPAWLGAVGLVLALPALNPRVLGVGGSRLASGDRLRLTPGATVWVVLLLLLTWGSYGAAVAVLLPDPSLRGLAVSAGAFAAAYAVGVVVVVAPAGLGARDLVLVALLAPATGLTAATAVALLTRLLHTAGDLGLALAAWSTARVRTREPAPHPARPSGDGAW